MNNQVIAQHEGKDVLIGDSVLPWAKSKEAGEIVGLHEDARGLVVRFGISCYPYSFSEITSAGAGANTKWEVAW